MQSSFRSRSCFFIMAILFFGINAQTEGKIRIYTNVDSTSFPAELKQNLDLHPWEKGYLDVTKAPYNAQGDGITDDTEAIQLAIDHAYACNFVVFFPYGEYLVSDQLRCYQDPGPQLPNNAISSMGQRKFGHLLLGSALGEWPVIRLKDNSLVKDNTLIVFKYYNAETQTEDASRHYLGSLRNFEIQMGENPDVSAVYNNGAQHCVLQNLKITGNFDKGISTLPGSGGYAANIEIVGGRIGVYQNNFRPNPTIFGLKLEGQSECGLMVLDTRGALSIAGFSISGPQNADANYHAVYIKNTSTSNELGARANLNLVDGSISVSGPAAAIYNYQQDLLIKNTWIKSAVIIESGHYDGSPETLSGSFHTWKHINEYVYGTIVDKGAVYINGLDQRSGNHDLALIDTIKSSLPPDDLLSRHLWAKLASWESDSLVDIVKDYGATPENESNDDALAIQTAIDEVSNPESPHFGKTVFIPRGHFHIKSPIVLKAGVKMIGAAKNISAIQVSDTWLPNQAVVALSTEDSNTAGIVLSDLALIRNEANIADGLSKLKQMTLFELKSGNSLIRDIQTDLRVVKWNANAYSEALLKVSGHGGGKAYGICLDYGTTGAADPGYRLLKIENTTHPVCFYQLSVEDASVEMNEEETVHMEITNCKQLTIFGFKYEKESELLHISNSDSISIIGGSGNYGIKDSDDIAIISITNTKNIYFANMSRQIQSGELNNMNWICDDGILVSASAPVVLYKKTWDPGLYKMEFHLKESASALPVENAEIEISGGQIASDEYGEADSSLIRGMYTIDIRHPYFTSYNTSFFHYKDTLLNLSLERLLVDVSFLVLDTDETEALVDADVILGGVQKKSDAMGQVLFPGLKKDSLYAFTIDKDGYLQHTGEFQASRDTSLTIALQLIELTQHFAAPKLLIYPNPTDGIIYLEIEMQEHPLELTLHNMSGRQMLAKNIAAESSNGALQLDVSKLEAGSYILKLSQNEENILCRRIIQKL